MTFDKARKICEKWDKIPIEERLLSLIKECEQEAIAQNDIFPLYLCAKEFEQLSKLLEELKILREQSNKINEVLSELEEMKKEIFKKEK